MATEELSGRKIHWRKIRIKTGDLEEARWPVSPHAPEVNLLPNTLTEHEKRQGWRLLWDGKTTKGWRSARGPEFPEKGWEIKDGFLTVMASGGAESANGGDIITEGKFSSFELKLEFKITEDANRGIKYFVDPEFNKGPGSSIGLEYQIYFVNWVFDSHPTRVIGFGGIDYWKYGRETFDNVNTLLEYPNGMKVNCISLTANAHEGYQFKFKGSKGTIELKIDQGWLYYETLNKKELGTVDGVSGATLKKMNSEERYPIEAENEKERWEGTHYAFMDFYNSILAGKAPFPM